MIIPKPGLPVRGSKTGQPIMALLDLLGRSWAMGIVWHLYKGPSTFRELQDYCESISPTTLNTRLGELNKCHLVERCLEGYVLTEYGRELFELLEPMGSWARHRWAKSFEENDRKK
ncbi:transcriptional regulator [Muricauda sp. JGD-17]|uniref:Transcriptional regulator n=1 Tax=Flagellimonas ochracea TaxID=2696472 RepID=A0A964WXM4_9FLAO|nr:helix-turn-helix domain-containing protein [Allomuricauda ochracea]NAY92017.1 transcriptional regulator [Allomuricauda ochracea]